MKLKYFVKAAADVFTQHTAMALLITLDFPATQ
jgi:hypothetical protein